MNRYISFMAMLVVLMLVISGDVSAEEQNSDVSLTITKFHVNDQILELSWKITNDSDHDVWICDGRTTGYYFDSFLDKDNETLKIMKRSDLPKQQGWEHWPWVRFIRLHPGQDKEDSISLTVPVRPQTEFGHSFGNAEYARRMAIEIGFYDEDLRGLILNIVDLTEQLSCDPNVLSSIVTPDAQILERFFAGVDIAQVFHDESFRGFRNKVLSDGDEISMPYMDQFLHGEQVLRIEVDGVSIPYKSSYPPLTDEPSQSKTEPAGVKMALTGFDVNDTTLELSYKIKNNTDHDVWICDSVSVFTGPDFEVYLSEDEQSLLIRRRLDVPTDVVWTQCPYGRYVLLRSGQERTESLSLAVPVTPRLMFAGGLATSDHARRLVLEIGFYNEDLPGLIRDILEMAEKLNCAHLDPSEYRTAFFMHYFKGIWIAHKLFGGLSQFEEYTYKEGSEEINIPYTWQKFNGEQVLRIEVDGVHIPYLGHCNLIPKDRTCFPVETPVWVDGMVVPISSVVAGQAVGRSLCTTPGTWTDQVEEVQEHAGTFECRDIILESGNHIGVVGNHCFMLSNGDWIAAQDLKGGLSLRTLQGTVRIKSVTVRTTPYTGKVYNLKIKNSDEYIVGRDAVIVRDY